MEQENATSLVQFWLTAENYRCQLSDSMHVADIERDTADAIAIYERCELPYTHIMYIISCQHAWFINFAACYYTCKLLFPMRMATHPFTVWL